MVGLSRAVAVFMTSSVVGTVTQVAKGKLSALYLGAEGVGVYNQISLFFTLVLTACVLGFPNGITRNIAIEHAAGRKEGFVTELASPYYFLGTLSLLLCGVGVFFSSQISHLLFADSGERALLVSLVLAGVPLAVLGYIYRALLNGTRSVNTLVKSRISADLISVALFAGLLIPFGIIGAVLGFVGLHLTYLVLVFFGTRRELGSLSIPRPSAFRWSAVRKNAGYGVHGLVVAAATSLTILIVSRWIIEASGLEQSGLFNIAYKVATVYLAGVYASATGYYYASIARAEDLAEVGREINNAIAIYMTLIPPLIACLIAGGDVLMLVFFSSEFIPAALILLVILPADIFRLISEVIGQALVAKQKLCISIAVYLTWIAIYLSAAKVLVGTHGIVGVAMAYMLGQFLLFFLMLIVGRVYLSYTPSARSWRYFVRALALSVVCALVTYGLENVYLKIAAGGALIIIWFGLSMFEEDFRRRVGMIYGKVITYISARKSNSPTE